MRSILAFWAITSALACAPTKRGVDSPGPSVPPVDTVAAAPMRSAAMKPTPGNRETRMDVRLELMTEHIKPWFSADGEHFAAGVYRDDMHVLVLDGQEVARSDRHFMVVELAPEMLVKKGRGTMVSVVVDGRPAKAWLRTAELLHFTDEGKVVYEAADASGAWVVVGEQAYGRSGRELHAGTRPCTSCTGRPPFFRWCVTPSGSSQWRQRSSPQSRATRAPGHLSRRTCPSWA